MNMQSLIMMDDFTVENGATACVPFTQREASWPDEDLFDKSFIQTTGKKGTVLLYTGLLNHAAQPNNTGKSRTSILGQYLPKYVRPMEDCDKGTSQEVRDRATPMMRQLLGMKQDYPKMFDEPNKKRYEYVWKFKFLNTCEIILI